jgi:hypothetical protein
MICKLFGHYLDRYFAVEFGVARAIHFTLAEFGGDFVMGDGGVDHVFFSGRKLNLLGQSYTAE